LGLTLQLSDLDDHNLTGKTSISQHQVNWYPRASLLYTPQKGKSINSCIREYDQSYDPAITAAA